MAQIDKIINVSLKIFKALMVVLMSVMVVSMFLQVVTRYALGKGFAWTEELSRFANVWMVFIGAAVLSFSDEHIQVTILDEMLKGNALKALKLFKALVFIIYSSLIVKVGIDTLSVVSKQTSPNMLVPMNYIYLVIPVGAALGILYSLRHILAVLKGDQNG